MSETEAAETSLPMRIIHASHVSLGTCSLMDVMHAKPARSLHGAQRSLHRALAGANTRSIMQCVACAEPGRAPRLYAEPTQALVPASLCKVIDAEPTRTLCKASRIQRHDMKSLDILGGVDYIEKCLTVIGDSFHERPSPCRIQHPLDSFGLIIQNFDSAVWTLFQANAYRPLRR